MLPVLSGSGEPTAGSAPAGPRVNRGGRPRKPETVPYPCRFATADYDRLCRLAVRHQITVQDAIRMAVRRLLTLEEAATFSYKKTSESHEAVVTSSRT